MRRGLGVRASAIAGALTGLAVVTIVWGAAWALPTAAPEPSSGPARPTPSATPKPSPSVVVDWALPALEKTRAPRPPSEPPATPEPPTPPVEPLALVTYEVAAKGDVQGDLEDFAGQVGEFLADPKGWPAAGIAFERVESGGDITVWLTEPSKVPGFSGICSPTLSCSIGRNIILNELRWEEGALPGVMDEVPIREYRKMVTNHEVGHWLGHHQHSACPGEGELAPLMMQQSKSLDGCLFNPYPLPDELTAPDLLP